MKNKLLLIILGAFLLSCSSAKIVPFSSVDTPKNPNYSKSESWAVLPGQYPESLTEVVGEENMKPVDVFFIYPTLFSDKKDPAWMAATRVAGVGRGEETKSGPFIIPCKK